MALRFRTDLEMNDTNGRASILDRAWDATRPPELAPNEADRIWAEVLRASEGPATLTMTPERSRRSRQLTALALVGFMLAQAAAIVVAIVLTVRPDPKHPPLMVKADPAPVPIPAPAPALLTRHDVEPYETFMASFSDKGLFVGEQRLKPSDSGPSCAYIDVPASNASDALAILETYAR